MTPEQEKQIQEFLPCPFCDHPHLFNGLGMTDLQKDWFMNSGYLWFVPLPDDFEMWHEI